MYKRFIFFFFILHYSLLSGQLNFYEKGQKAFYWGISLGVNSSDFSVDRQPLSGANDTIRNVSSRMSPGFNLGLIGNWQFNRYFDLRFIPNMTFGEKIIEFQTENMLLENKISTTYISFPVLIRFKAEPVNDWRLFLVGGLKYEYNINSQKKSDAEPQKIILKKDGLSAEYGVGLQYFFPYFIFSPEIKFSHSLFNMYDSNQSDLNNSAIKSLFPRALTLTLNFEG